MIPGTFIEQVKKCIHCDKLLPATSYHKNPHNRDGLSSCCRQCKSVQQHRAYSKKRSTIDYSLRSMLSDAKKRAKRQNVPFSLTLEYLRSLVVSHCPITLAPIDWTKAEVVNGTSGENSPSLDKIIPELGYVKGNCAIISHRGNVIKSNGTIDEHRRIIKYMAEQQLKHIDF